jgi:DNA polymerase IV
MPALCRDCFAVYETAPRRCPACGRPRLLSHPELFRLSIAHLDCDAFYASVEKRDDPSLADKPVIVGGGTRGVVSTCCYIARIKGVRSAMPMGQALRLCPEAVVIRPRHSHYAAVSAQIRDRMEVLTPQIEPLSLDEAFLDMTGTERLHAAPPAVMLARLAKQIEDELGVTASVGLAHNKFLAKIASDLDKPRGFSVIGVAETADFLRDKPVRILWGVGAATQTALAAAGIRTLADIRRQDPAGLTRRFGAQGTRLWHLAHGEDARRISRDHALKSVSKETTFNTDISNAEELAAHLWRLSVQVADRMKEKGLVGRCVTLKLRRADFTSLTRRITLDEPVQLADALYRAGDPLLRAVLKTEKGAFRLIGIGYTELTPAPGSDPIGDLLDPQAATRAKAERATDAIRARFGDQAIIKGRSIT